MFCLVLRYGISTTLLQILISLRFPIHPYKGVHCCYRKGYLRFRRHRRLYFEKITAPNISAYFAYFPREASRVEFFLHTLAGLPGNFRKSSLEQLFCREPVNACFSKKDLHSILISGIFQNFKNIQGQAASCNLKLAVC